MPRTTRSAAKASQAESSSADADDLPKPAASFAGQLELSSFAFTSATSPTSSISSNKRNASPLKRARTSTTPHSETTTTTSSSSLSSCAPGTSSPNSRSKRRKAGPTTYTPPSTYSHFPLLPDAMGPSLLVMFVGLNPGLQTSRSGHAYAHPSNLFWKLLHSSGLTPGVPIPLRPEEDKTLPARFSLGLTNIVARPSRNGAELSKQEMDDGVALLHHKAARARAEVVCLVGKSIWESVWRVTHGRKMRKEEFKYGWQDESERMGLGLDEIVPLGEEGLGVEERKGKYEGARVFVASSTSGLAATLSTAEKERIWKELGNWAQMRRGERAVAAKVGAEKNKEKRGHGASNGAGVGVGGEEGQERGGVK